MCEIETKKMMKQNEKTPSNSYRDPFLFSALTTKNISRYIPSHHVHQLPIRLLILIQSRVTAYTNARVPSVLEWYHPSHRSPGPPSDQDAETCSISDVLSSTNIVRAHEFQKWCLPVRSDPYASKTPPSIMRMRNQSQQRNADMYTPPFLLLLA